MAEVVPISKPKLPCGTCKYQGWLGLRLTCRHPDHVERIIPDRWLKIMQHGGRCPDYIGWEAKVMAGKEPPWPDPVSLANRGGN